MRIACLVVVGLIVFALSVSPRRAQSQTLYDLNTAWSDSSNPNNVWTYREGSNALPHVNAWQGLIGDFSAAQPAWARADVGNTNLPAWMKVVAPTNIAHDWQLGDIIVHTTDSFNGVGSGDANVIWTSPITGTINIGGGVWMGRDIGRSNHWNVSLDAAVLSGGDIFSGDPYSRASPFNFAAGSGGAAAVTKVAVFKGDVIELKLTKTSAPGDYVGVNLGITALAGDVNFDGIINGQDIALIASNWLATGSRGAGDANGDGIVNGQDIALIASNWLQTLPLPAGGSGSAATVPEPCTAILAWLGGLSLLLAGRLRSLVRSCEPRA